MKTDKWIEHGGRLSRSSQTQKFTARRPFIYCETFTLLVGRSQQSVTFGKQRKGGIGRGTSE